MKTILKDHLPAGPKGHLFSGSSREMKDDPLGFLSQCRDQYGDIVPFRMGVFPILFVNDPELIHEILVTQAHNFSKDVALKNNREFFGYGLLSSEGDYWKQQRKLSSPSFSPKKLESYSQIMVEHTNYMLSNWRHGNIYDIQHEMMQLTLSIATKTLFDLEIEKEVEELETALTDAQKHLANRMNSVLLLLFPEWVPFPTNVALLTAIRKIDKVIYRLIKERRSNAQGRNDLLSTFLSVEDEDGTKMTDRQIRDEVFTLFFAGHETTALTLTWTLYLLCKHPHIEEQLVSEIQQVLHGRKPTIADYGQLSFVEKTIKESMRIRPPVWAIGRECINNCQIGNYEIQKNTAVIISQWTMHHDKRYYKDPECFDPNRWTNEMIAQLPKFAYFPFGGGPRTCIGNGFAMIESVLALTTILQEFHLEFANDNSIELNPAVTLRPKNKIVLKAYKRQ
jgi:cytochrome P450